MPKKQSDQIKVGSAVEHDHKKYGLVKGVVKEFSKSGRKAVCFFDISAYLGEQKPTLIGLFVLTKELRLAKPDPPAKRSAKRTRLGKPADYSHKAAREVLCGPKSGFQPFPNVLFGLLDLEVTGALLYLMWWEFKRCKDSDGWFYLTQKSAVGLVPGFTARVQERVFKLLREMKIIEDKPWYKTDANSTSDAKRWIRINYRWLSKVAEQRLKWDTKGRKWCHGDKG